MPCQTLIGQILIQRALFPEIRNEFSNRKFLFLKKLNHSLTIFFCALVFTCVDVRLMTCARFGRDQACTKVDASFFPFAPPHPKSSQFEWRPFVVKATYWPMKSQPWKPSDGVFLAICLYLRVRLATQRKSARKFNLRLLASPFGQGLQYRRSKVPGKHYPLTSLQYFSDRTVLNWVTSRKQTMLTLWPITKDADNLVNQ